jgi:hypothetical protein
MCKNYIRFLLGPRQDAEADRLRLPPSPLPRDGHFVRLIATSPRGRSAKLLPISSQRSSVSHGTKALRIEFWSSPPPGSANRVRHQRRRASVRRHRSAQGDRSMLRSIRPKQDGTPQHHHPNEREGDGAQRRSVRVRLWSRSRVRMLGQTETPARRTTTALGKDVAGG